MTRKVARQSEITPTHTVDEYLWNERLGVAAIPPVDTTQPQPQTSSLPPQSSAAPTINYDAAQSQSDMFGSGVSGEGQLIAPKTPNTTPASVPARSRVAAVSTVYGDVEPTPTTGESGDDGAQANRNNSSEKLPNGPDSGGSPTTPAAVGEEAGGAGLASDIGEAASIAALASKHWIGSTLDPVEDNLKTAKYKYIRHNKKTGKWEIWQKSTGKTLSTHDSKADAEKAFRGMMQGMHG